MKSCESCAHRRGIECEAPASKRRIDPVSGAAVREVPLCRMQRVDGWGLDVLYGTCGTRGRWWEAIRETAPPAEVVRPGSRTAPAGVRAHEGSLIRPA